MHRTQWFLLFISALAELHAQLSITGEGNVDEAIAEIVSEFDLTIRERNMERNEEDVVELNEELHRLGDQVRLIAFRQSSGITVYILCLALTSVQQLYEVYLRGELNSILENVFTILLRTKSRPVVNIRQLEWSSSNYDECVQLLQMAPGKNCTSGTLYVLLSNFSCLGLRFQVFRGLLFSWST